MDALESGFGLPPFKARQASTINTDLGFFALPEDYTAIPITVFNNNDVHDDTGAYGCNYLTIMNGIIVADPRTWIPFKPQREAIQEAIDESLNLDPAKAERVSWPTFQGYTDTDTARDF